MEKQTTNNPPRQLPAIAHWMLAGVALGCAYLAISMAIDSGSLLSYAAALILFALGIKNLMQGMKKAKDRIK